MADDARAELEALLARLRAAEDVCVLVAWTPAGDSTRAKALHELWLRWRALPGASDDPKGNTHLDDALIDALAAARDATRANTLAKIAGEPLTFPAPGPQVPLGPLADVQALTRLVGDSP